MACLANFLTEFANRLTKLRSCQRISRALSRYQVMARFNPGTRCISCIGGSLLFLLAVSVECLYPPCKSELR